MSMYVESVGGVPGMSDLSAYVHVPEYANVGRPNLDALLWRTRVGVVWAVHVGVDTVPAVELDPNGRAKIGVNR